MRNLKTFAVYLVLAFILLEILNRIMPYPIYYDALVEYRFPQFDITGRGKCRVENSLPVERGWLYGGKTQRGHHLRGLTDNMLIVERTCPECEFQEVLRVYRVDRDKVYIVYPEFRELKCDWKFVPMFMVKGEKINDLYQACLRKIHFGQS